jgi:heterodisulfide reductase subunit B
LAALWPLTSSIQLLSTDSSVSKTFAQEKMAKNRRKVKDVALLFCHFCPIFINEKSVPKMDEKG